MSEQTRRSFAEVVRREPVDLGLACLLVAAEADPGVSVADGLAHLDALAAAARPLVPVEGRAGPATPAGQAEGLRRALGEHAGFAGSAEDYGDLRASLLPEVLARRRGLPILLSVVWLEVARRLGVPAYPVGMPGHVVVGIGTPGHGVLVDPFAGGRTLSAHEAAERVRAAGVPFTREHLAPTPPVELLLRVLSNIRMLAARTDRPRVRLWAVELSLLLPRHPAALRRERGELLARLGDYLGAAAELSAYADAVAPAEPTVAQAARVAARAALARLS
ncbi:MAG TPA: transglutaminase-like domain-containing protein [Frankiaceae bacterium]|nr:transglutaminase-like domain-containing protein [Frankiaceae bacterium]